ncbi:hypothetical protein M4R22_20655 [Acidovorax sp. GBBC 3334]|uniref:hypothetical protein n=1 Tax=unclassified Acidovorax TaxID=2684926 RepID=UPI002303C2A8|nr:MULTISPECIES: hypothetical protein [unclassified Acidovorax]MDA8457175.1 hypothetical protein [Acidovorax sp. GBBC 3334]MDA8521563.1 hypothetical protein [Acidovorax sp. NCPPB 4044]
MASTLTTTISGTIEIGSGANPIAIPINSVLPPTTPGQLKFTYQLPAGQAPTSFLSVGDLVTWAATNLSSPVTAADLPSSLTTLSVAVDNLLIDTQGEFELGMLFGSDTGGKWNPTWTPFAGVALLEKLSLANVKIEFDYGAPAP